MRRRLSLILVAASAMSSIACGSSGSSTSTDGQNGVRSFDVRGVVESVPAGGKALVVRHEEIPGFMPAMTMELRLRDPLEARNILANDEITFQLFSTDDTHWIANVTRVGTAAGSANSAQTPSVSEAELAVGDMLPDHSFTSEAGETVRFADFRGKALAFTFIFTRCPIADFCPRMSKNLARARERLIEADTPSNWQFLSISFDPEFDNPQVLKKYADIYREGDATNWLFASASTDTLAKLAPQVDLMFKREQGGSIGHNLRTVVVDPSGKVYRQFDGNEWTGDELAAAVAEAAKLAAAP